MAELIATGATIVRSFEVSAPHLMLVAEADGASPASVTGLDLCTNCSVSYTSFTVLEMALAFQNPETVDDSASQRPSLFVTDSNPSLKNGITDDGLISPTLHAIAMEK